MQEWPRDFIQTHIVPLLSAIKDRVLGLGYTRLPIHAHLMARELLARATVAALKRIPFPGPLALGDLLAVEFARLLPFEIEREYERIQANPVDWIRPGNPIALIFHQDLADDHKALTAILAFLTPLLDQETLADDDAKYIAQRIADDGALPLLQSVLDSGLPDVRIVTDIGGLPVTVTMEPLVPGGPSEEAPIYYVPDVTDGGIEWSDEAQHDADVYDWFVRMFTLAPSSTVEGFFAKLDNVEWLEDTLPHLSERKQALIVHIFVYGPEFDVAALCDGTTPGDVLIEIFETLTYLRQVWDEDHPWA